MKPNSGELSDRITTFYSVYSWKILELNDNVGIFAKEKRTL